MVCLCPTGDALSDARAQAELLIADGDADEALLVLVEQAGGDGGHDQAQALVVRRGGQR